MKKLEMQKNNISYLYLFLSLFKINSITFGGGYTIIPVIKQTFVDNKKLLSEKEMMDIISLATSVPGAMAIATSYLLGYRLKGFLGGIIAVIASVMPCLIIISLISVAYTKFITNIYVKASLSGIGAMVSAILLVTVYKMFVKMKKDFIWLFIISFIIGYFFKLNVAIILLMSAIVALLYNLKRGDKK